MARLPVISGADAVKACESIPSWPLAALRALIRAAAMSVEEFAALL